MTRFVTTETITIPAGTVFETSDVVGEGGLEMDLTTEIGSHGCMRVFLGEIAALDAGLIVVPLKDQLVAKRATHLRVVG